MTYAKACAEYELFRGKGFGVSLVKTPPGFDIELLSVVGTGRVVRSGCEDWEIVRGKSQRYSDRGEMPAPTVRSSHYTD